MYSLNCKGNLINLSQPKIMGILNVTPDSFLDGGRYKSDKDLLLQTEKMLKEGACFIDVGGVSSKPFANFVNEETELKRVLPVISLLLKNFPNILISVDTFRSKIAKESIFAGACMINDIHCGNADSKMFETIKNLQVPYIVMHMQGIPENMQENPHYENVVKEVYRYLSEKSFALRTMGINDFILDVGFGFGKTIQHNYTLLKNLDFFQNLQTPILVGISQKSMIYKIVDSLPKNALNGTTAANTIALLKGANLLRVHNVKAAMECIKIVSELA